MRRCSAYAWRAGRPGRRIGPAADQIAVFLPQHDVLLSSEVIPAQQFPALNTLRGEAFRNPVDWYLSIDTLRRFRAAAIVPSHGVHTIGMLFPIDLIYLSREKEVVHVEEHVRPFRISKVSLKAASVLELPPHTIYRSGTQVGDKLEIAPVR